MTNELARLLLLLAIIPLFGSAPLPAVASDGLSWPERSFLNIAHRGGRFEAPEHTLYAYRRAQDLGVDMLEVDVALTADGEVVVMHDGSVDRTTDSTGAISALTLAQIEALDAAYWYSPDCPGTCTGLPVTSYPFRGVATGGASPPAGSVAEDFRVPTFEEVLQAFPDMLMTIELKGSAATSLPLGAAAANLLAAYGRTDDVLVASFDDALLDEFKLNAPGVPTSPGETELTAWILGGFQPPLATHSAIQMPRTFSSVVVAVADLMDAAHAEGLPVYVFIDPSEETVPIYNELIDAGADGIITDTPSALEAVIQARGVSYPPALPGLGAFGAFALATIIAWSGVRRAERA